MKKLSVLIISLAIAHLTTGQKIGGYAFVRTPQLVNFHFESATSTFSQGISTGFGITHESLFAEVGTFMLQGNSYGYYSFFGSNLKSIDLGNSFALNTNLFGEVTRVPSQAEQSEPVWIFTSGICLFPNVQIQNMNVGIPLCLGLASQEGSLYLNSRFILNISFSIR